MQIAAAGYHRGNGSNVANTSHQKCLGHDVEFDQKVLANRSIASSTTASFVVQSFLS